jgi:hypothetical protein
MHLSKEHIYRFCSIVFFSIGFLIFSLIPTAGFAYTASASGLLLEGEANVCSSTYADDLDLPVDERVVGNRSLLRLSLREGADKREAENGMNGLAYINQVHSYSFVPTKGFSVEAQLFIKRHQFIEEKLLSLFNRLSASGYHLKFAPLISGIAIHAP